MIPRKARFLFILLSWWLPYPFMKHSWAHGGWNKSKIYVLIFFSQDAWKFNLNHWFCNVLWAWPSMLLKKRSNVLFYFVLLCGHIWLCSGLFLALCLVFTFVRLRVTYELPGTWVSCIKGQKPTHCTIALVPLLWRIMMKIIFSVGKGLNRLFEYALYGALSVYFWYL